MKVLFWLLYPIEFVIKLFVWKKAKQLKNDTELERATEVLKYKKIEKREKRVAAGLAVKKRSYKG